jgi:NIMA (never in mitosis gene a)-related kinase
MPAHDYQKVKEIGAGSFGKAVLVKNKDGRQFVMKCVDTNRMTPKERKIALSEAKVLGALKHPYIIGFRESYMDGNTLCILMDYAEGGDLFKTIDRTRRKMQKISEAKILRWATQILLALKYLHDKHVLHRDLKSQNIFISASGRIKLGDFGISRVLENTNCFAKTSIGTPYYLAPEICQQKPYSWSADIWAVGCILYELAMLKVPFDAGNFQQLCNRIITGQRPKISKPYSDGLRDMCYSMLNNDARKRPSAADLLQLPLVQDEIRKMLEEERGKKDEGKPLGDAKQAAPRPPTPPKGHPPPVPGRGQENRHPPSVQGHGHGHGHEKYRRPASANQPQPQVRAVSASPRRNPAHGGGLRY